MSRAFAQILAMSVWALSACTGLQGGEPHDDDDASSSVPSDDRLDECSLSFTDAT